MSDWSTLRKLMWLRGSTGGGGSPLTVTGSTPLLMPGALAKPMRKATFAIEAVQAGTGDPSPQNVRAISGHQSMTAWVSGKNLFDPNGTFPVTGGGRYFREVINSATTCVMTLVEKDPTVSVAGMYFGWAYKPDIIQQGFAWVLNNGVYTNAVTNIVPSGQGAQGEKMRYVTYYPATDATITAILKRFDIQIEPGSTASPYTPYSGSTVSVEFPAMGKNLCPRYTDRTSNNGINYTVTDAGIRVNGTATGASYSWETVYTYDNAPIHLPAGTYNFNVTDMVGVGQAEAYLNFMGKTASGTDLGNVVTLHGKALRITKVFTEPVGLYYGFYVKQGLTVDSVVKVQIEAGSSKTTYEPFTNTIYSGTVDPVTGQGVVTHKCVTFDGNTNPNDLGITVTGSFTQASWIPFISTGKAGNDFVSDKLKTGSETVYGIWGSSVPRMFMGLPTSVTDKAEAVAWFAENPVTVVYPLADPIPFTVPPQSLTPPAGDAYIWADCGSTAEVAYIGKA